MGELRINLACLLLQSCSLVCGLHTTPKVCVIWLSLRRERAVFFRSTHGLAVHVEAKYSQTSPDFAYFFVPLSVSSVLNPVCLDLSAPQVETRIWREKQGCCSCFASTLRFASRLITVWIECAHVLLHTIALIFRNSPGSSRSARIV